MVKKSFIKKLKSAAAISLAACIFLVGCGSASSESAKEEPKETVSADSTNKEADSTEGADAAGTEEEVTKEEVTEDENATADITSVADAPVIDGLTVVSSMPLEYATEFSVYYYTDDYKAIVVNDSSTYLMVPEGKETPEGLDSSIIVLQQPLTKIYLAATSAMSLFAAIDGLDPIRFSSLNESGWYVDAAKEAMQKGDIVFAGKYSEPDYELLLNEGCDLAIESTMIYHSPKVQEMIETLGIPVFIDRSSYESHPLGRTEWVKLYAAMLNKEEAANTFFKTQSAIIDEVKDYDSTGKTVAYFYISTDGKAVVRSTTDYIPKMIELAGAEYVFAEILGDDSEENSASVSMTLEEFYSAAVNADYLIYNASIDSTVTSIDVLLQKSALFKDFKAVKEGNVWSSGKSLYQATDIVGELIRDIRNMITDGKEEDMTFLSKLQ